MPTSSSTLQTERICCPICVNSPQEHMFQIDGWNIVRCLYCGLAMVNPRRTNCTEIYENDAYFSDEQYYYDYEGNKSAYQKGFRSKLDLIERFCPGRGKLLDVGAAYGFFMEEATNYGFEPSGVELCKRAAEYASRYGPVFQKPLSDIDTDYRFSVVTFIDSLEHFENPMDGLRKARELLEYRGIVAAMVPNIDSLFARLTKTKWHLLLPEEHLFYFNRNSIRLMLEKSGFEMVHLGTGGYGRSIDEIMHVVFRGKRLPIESLGRLLRKISIEVNLGDIFVIARKVE